MLQEPESSLPGAAGGIEGREGSMEQKASSSFGARRQGRDPRLRLVGFLALDNSPLVVDKRELGN